MPPCLTHLFPHLLQLLQEINFLPQSPTVLLSTKQYKLNYIITWIKNKNKKININCNILGSAYSEQTSNTYFNRTYFHSISSFQCCGLFLSTDMSRSTYWQGCWKRANKLELSYQIPVIFQIGREVFLLLVPGLFCTFVSKWIKGPFILQLRESLKIFFGILCWLWKKKGALLEGKPRPDWLKVLSHGLDIGYIPIFGILGWIHVILASIA